MLNHSNDLLHSINISDLFSPYADDVIDGSELASVIYNCSRLELCPSYIYGLTTST